MKTINLALGLGCAVIPQFSTGAPAQEAARPNVLLIIMDDMPDWAGYLGGNEQAITPNLDKLSERGVWFGNAYCAAPFSNPSRAAMLTGLQPATTGIYNNQHQLMDSPRARQCTMMPEHFRDNGYKTLWAGKVFHNRPAEPRLERMWDDMECRDGGYGPFVHNSILPENLTGDMWRNFEAWEGPDTDFPDVVNTDKVVDFLSGEHSDPFFIAMGLYRPHAPYTAPKRYFDMYDIDAIERPLLLEGDLDDIPQFAIDNFIKPRNREAFKRWSTTGNWFEQLIRAYLASITFADDCVGRMLDALEGSPYADNTVVIVVGDNGFHMGQKERFGKEALWREACHVPFIVSWPEGIATSGSVAAPVSLIDIYPTLVKLCRLPRVPELEGNDLSPLLKDPAAKWDKPCISTFLPGNFVVHSGDWNYIRYRDGSHELYNITSDEDEFYNVADLPEHKSLIRKMASSLPKEWHPGLRQRKVDNMPRIVHPVVGR